MIYRPCLPVALVVLLGGAGVVEAVPSVSEAVRWYPWPRSAAGYASLADRFPAPAGYARVDVPPGSYAEWLRHPRGDPWWDYADMAGRYDRVTAAVLNLSGWHDDSFSTHGAIANHLGLLLQLAGHERVE